MAASSHEASQGQTPARLGSVILRGSSKEVTSSRLARRELLPFGELGRHHHVEESLALLASAGQRHLYAHARPRGRRRVEHDGRAVGRARRQHLPRLHRRRQPYGDASLGFDRELEQAACLHVGRQRHHNRLPARQPHLRTAEGARAVAVRAVAVRAVVVRAAVRVAAVRVAAVRAAMARAAVVRVVPVVVAMVPVAMAASP